MYNAYLKGGRTALHWAAAKARIKAIELLVGKGATIDMPDKVTVYCTFGIL